MTIHNNDSGIPRNSDPKKKNQNKLSPLSLFPSFGIITVAVVVSILLNLFCGIKIFNLEYERHQLQLKEVSLVERFKLLEADINSHAKLLQELPGLKSLHTTLNAEIAALNENIIHRTDRKTKLSKKIEFFQKDLEEAVANKNQAEASAKALRKETGQLQSKIASLQSEESILGVHVARLRQDTVGMESKQMELSTRLQSLTADVTSLEAKKDSRISELEVLTSDNSRLVKVNSRLTSLVSSMESSKGKAERAATSLKDSAENAQRTVSYFKTQTQSTGNAIKDLNTSTQNFNDLIQNTHKDQTKLATTVEGLTQSSSKLTDQVTQLATLIDGAKQSLNSNTAALDKQLKDFSSKINKISDSQKQLKSTTELLDSYPRKFESFQTELASKTQEFSDKVNQLSRITTEIDTETQTLRKNTHNLETEYTGVANAAAILNTQVQAAERTFLKFSTFITNLLSNDNGSKKINQGLEGTILELKNILTKAVLTLDEFRILGENASSALHSNGNNIKTILENIVQDTKSLENEIRTQLKEVQDQRDQLKTPASATNSNSSS